jgi:hypothetical protein
MHNWRLLRDFVFALHLGWNAQLVSRIEHRHLSSDYGSLEQKIDIIGRKGAIGLMSY